MINYILNYTNHDKMTYIGHSEGTTQVFAGASLIPEFYNTKLNLAILLSPAASMADNPKLTNQFLSLEPIRHIWEYLIRVLKFWNIIPYNYIFNEYTFALYRSNPLLCEYIMY